MVVFLIVFAAIDRIAVTGQTFPQPMGIHGNATDFGTVLLAFLLLNYWKLPAWALVLGCGLVGGIVL
ncbi:hypothetical protein [Pasteurella testudinis]|uniref:hypothetical protein n=1 Tax=Pasteurella testudinis TaxID=761 RepID=UPI004059D07A